MDRVQLVEAESAGTWELPVLGAVTAPAAVLIRPDGYVAWVGEGTHVGLEGTQATLTDLIEFEAKDDAEPTPDIEEVCNYVEALKYARGQLGSANGLPLSMRLLNETHKRLMRGVR